MKKTQVATEILVSHYAKTFSAFGANAEGVDWGSREKHRLRLKAMVQHIGVDAVREDGLLDVGCGYGELLSVLDESFGIEPMRYCGIDPCAPLVEVARTTYPQHRFEAVALEDFAVNQPIEHLLCCGVFTKKLQVADEAMYQLMDAFFDKAVEMDVRTVTFNTMSPFCDIRPNELFFPNIDRIADLMGAHWGYGMRKFCFLSDYLQYEMLTHIVL